MIDLQIRRGKIVIESCKRKWISKKRSGTLKLSVMLSVIRLCSKRNKHGLIEMLGKDKISLESERQKTLTTRS